MARPTRGIGKIIVTAYTHDIKVCVQSICLDTQIDFSYEIDYPLLQSVGRFLIIYARAGRLAGLITDNGDFLW